MGIAANVGKSVLDAVVEPVVLITTKLKLAHWQIISGFQLAKIRMPVPPEHLHQLPEMLGHHRHEKAVDVLPFLEIDHEEVNELTGLDLVVVSIPKLQ